MADTEAAAPDERHAIGGNIPPLDPADELLKRLERDQAPLLDKAAAIDGRRLKLVAQPQTDEEAAAITDWIADAGGTGRESEKTRLATTEPYRLATDKANGWFGEISVPLKDQIEAWKRVLKIYQDAKAAREEAERRRLAKLAQDRADEEAARQRLAQKVADDAEAEAQRARESLRSGELDTAEAREEAETTLRQASQAGAAARQEATEAGKAAVQQTRLADTNERHAASGAGALGRVTTGGASTANTKFWTHTITDAVALLNSLGPVGKWLNNDDISQALRAAVRDGVRDTDEGPAFPGVKIFQDSRVDVRAKR